MTNHVHLVAVPERPAAFAEALGRLHGEYARRLHERWGGNGHLWQNRFYSCPLDRDHVWTALRYVDLNPLRAGLVEDAMAYEWSSARAHAEGRSLPVVGVTNARHASGIGAPGEAQPYRTNPMPRAAPADALHYCRASVPAVRITNHAPTHLPHRLNGSTAQRINRTTEVTS